MTIQIDVIALFWKRRLRKKLCVGDMRIWEEEVQQLLATTENCKHRAAVWLFCQFVMEI